MNAAKVNGALLSLFFYVGQAQALSWDQAKLSVPTYAKNQTLVDGILKEWRRLKAELSDSEKSEILDLQKRSSESNAKIGEEKKALMEGATTFEQAENNLRGLWTEQDQRARRRGELFVRAVEALHLAHDDLSLLKVTETLKGKKITEVISEVRLYYGTPEDRFLLTILPKGESVLAAWKDGRKALTFRFSDALAGQGKFPNEAAIQDARRVFQLEVSLAWITEAAHYTLSLYCQECGLGSEQPVAVGTEMLKTLFPDSETQIRASSLSAEQLKSAARVP